MLPLAGVRVIDLSLLLPGPLATQILRDLGAEVIKIEPPYPGDYSAHWPPLVGNVSAMYQAVNRGKQVLSLNLKEATDRDRFHEMARTCDVIVEGFRPGVVEKLGIGYPQLSERNPRIILCSISGYGQDGPYAQRGGHDLNYQAIAGVLSISGEACTHPPNPQLQVADTAAGSYAAAMLVMAALLERDKTGRGRHVDISMSEQLLPLMTTLYATVDAEQRDPVPDAELLSGGAPSYRIYRTKDGAQISVGALEPKFWQALVVALGLPHLAEVNHLVGPQSKAIAGELARAFASKTRDQWIEIFAGVDACVEPVLTFRQAKKHPQWQARRSFEKVPTPDGRTLEVPRMPGSLAGFG
jgi:crotonobetainyl-CoA:carnitine CoA-transferase CaiB-like acyl-CoA transferase